MKATGAQDENLGAYLGRTKRVEASCEPGNTPRNSVFMKNTLRPRSSELGCGG